MRDAPPVGSRFQIGQTVTANFGPVGKLFPCVISAISFTDYGKVLYDLYCHPYPDEVGEDEHGEYDHRHIKFHLKGVDSCALEDPADEIIENILKPDNNDNN